jgi:hypothetical protein
MPFQGARVQFLVSCRCRKHQHGPLFSPVGVVDGCLRCACPVFGGRRTAVSHAALRAIVPLNNVRIGVGEAGNKGRSADVFRLGGGTFGRSRPDGPQKVWAIALPAGVALRNMERSAARIVRQRPCFVARRVPMFLPLWVPIYGRAATSAASRVAVSGGTRCRCKTTSRPASVSERNGCSAASPVSVLTTITGGHHDR